MSSLLQWLRNIILILGIIVFLTIYAPLVVQEVTYRVRPPGYYTVADGPANEILNVNPDKRLKPVDTQFGIVIPKINANSPIVKNVDPDEQSSYQEAFASGIAHVVNSALPGQDGSMILFSHKEGNFWQGSRYNAIFYLINKLEAEDPIYVYLNKRKYTYSVTNRTTLNPNSAIYDPENYAPGTLVLVTNWPPGTTFKRVVVEAVRNESDTR